VVIGVGAARVTRVRDRRPLGPAFMQPGGRGEGGGEGGGGGMGRWRFDRPPAKNRRWPALEAVAGRTVVLTTDGSSRSRRPRSGRGMSGGTAPHGRLDWWHAWCQRRRASNRRHRCCPGDGGAQFVSISHCSRQYWLALAVRATSAATPSSNESSKMGAATASTTRKSQPGEGRTVRELNGGPGSPISRRSRRSQDVQSVHESRPAWRRRQTH